MYVTGPDLGFPKNPSSSTNMRYSSSLWYTEGTEKFRDLTQGDHHGSCKQATQAVYASEQRVVPTM